MEFVKGVDAFEALVIAVVLVVVQVVFSC